MTDSMVTLAWCGLILLVFCGFGATAEWLQRRREHRRTVKKELRLARRYTAAVAPPYDRERVADVIPFPSYGHSVKVPDEAGRYGWRVDGGAA